jgi:transmembrane sensor
VKAMSIDAEKELSRAGRHVNAGWDEERRERVLGGLHRRRRRRTVLKTAAAVAVLITAGAALMMLHGPSGDAPTVAIEKSGAGEVRLADGSLISLLDEKSAIRTEENSVRNSTVVKVGAGRAKFNVVHKPGRSFVVEAGGISVIVVGTVFTVDRSGAEVKVSVQQGRVRVMRDGSITELGGGESGAFPATSAPNAYMSDSADASVPVEKPAPKVAMQESSRPETVIQRDLRSQAAAVQKPSQAVPDPDWRTLAQNGMFDKAYALLMTRREEIQPNDAGDLLLMADVARLAGHPQSALAPLKRVVDTCRTDPRAPLAAFTLGKVLLDELGDPRGAADAFARARSLAPEGPMSEDALAREVEAHWRAGETGLARERAEEYVKKYPEGRRVGPVKHYGGID